MTAHFGAGLSQQENALDPVLEFAKPEEIVRRDAIRAQLAPLEKELLSYEMLLAAKAGGKDKAKDIGYQERQATIAGLRKREPKIPYTLIMRELSKPRETHILLGGDFLAQGRACLAGRAGGVASPVEREESEPPAVNPLAGGP